MIPALNDSNIDIARLEMGPYSTNAYIIACKSTGELILVDAPAEYDKILHALHGRIPLYIVITHNHFDHTGALARLKSILPSPVACHPLDASGLPCSPDIELNGNDIISMGKLKLQVIHTPGHTTGSICLHTPGYLLAGDTIFPGGPGHTSTPADLDTILQAITSRILPLPDDTTIYPGHGDPAVLGDERKAIISFISGPRPAELCGDVLWSPA